MMRIRSLDSLLKLLMVAVLVIPVAACDSPVEDDEEHPVGIVLVNAQGQNAVTITAGPTVTGQVTLGVNANQTFTVFAISEAGARLALVTGELEVRIATQPQNAIVTLQGGSQLTVQGRTAGTGTLRLVLVHEGHDELAGNIPVVVQ